VAALVALVVYCLACVYPVAWSPDSTKLVFPVAERRRKGWPICGLVMTGLDGRAIRLVAHAPGNDQGLSPAAWSPDGKWIAYLRFERESEEDKHWHSVTHLLVIQDAESGEERVIFSMAGQSCDLGENPNAAYGPTWLPDSSAVVVHKTTKEALSIVMADVSGSTAEEIRCLPTGDAAASSFSLSPDGKRLAYVTKPGRDLHILDLTEGTRTKLPAVPCASEEDLCRPQWSSDGRFLYVPSEDEASEEVQVCRVDVRTGEADVVWRDQNAKGVCGTSLSRDSGFLAVSYLVDEPEDEDYFGVHVVNTRTGELVPVHFSSEPPWYGSTMSPDGERIALWTVTVDRVGPENVGSVGMIMSKKGEDLRFFLPEPELELALPYLMWERTEGALVASGTAQAFNDAGLDVEEIRTREELQTAVSFLEEAEAEHTAPVFREAIACAILMAHCSALKESPSAELAAPAREEAEAFLRQYPGHPVGRGLKARLLALQFETLLDTPEVQAKLEEAQIALSVTDETTLQDVEETKARLDRIASEEGDPLLSEAFAWAKLRLHHELADRGDDDKTRRERAFSTEAEAFLEKNPDHVFRPYLLYDLEALGDWPFEEWRKK